MNETSMLIYGPSKIGKTGFAATAPNPFFIDFENKTEDSINPGRKDVTIWKECGSFKDICRGIKTAREMKDQIIVFDTVTVMANIIMKENMRENMRETSDWDDNDYVFWKVNEILSKLTELNLPFIMLAHETVFQYARNHPRRKPSISGNKLQTAISGIPHIVGYLHVNDSGVKVISVRSNQDYECGFNCQVIHDSIPEFKPNYQDLTDFVSPQPIGKKVAKT